MRIQNGILSFHMFNKRQFLLFIPIDLDGWSYFGIIGKKVVM